jgi:CheY-like chemotaxis protein
MAKDLHPVILVVDDEPLILDMVQEILNMEGFETMLANSAEEALDLLDGDNRPKCPEKMDLNFIRKFKRGLR